jgi:hypothetical protein
MQVAGGIPVPLPGTCSPSPPRWLNQTSRQPYSSLRYTYTVIKKFCHFNVPSQDVTDQSKLFLPRESLVSDIPAGDRKVVNPHQNDQGRKGSCCFQRLIALKSVKKLKKISIPSLLSLLSSEPNFLLIK